MANMLHKKHGIVVNKTSLMLLVVLPMQNNKSVKTLLVYSWCSYIEEYSILCGISCQIQHLALPCAVYVTGPPYNVCIYCTYMYMCVCMYTCMYYVYNLLISYYLKEYWSLVCSRLMANYRVFVCKMVSSNIDCTRIQCTGDSGGLDEQYVDPCEFWWKVSSKIAWHFLFCCE